ncbi:porin family protein [Flavobacterium difficile]|uniref:PorT family protein n=1 Tax=Flavobacterium difficile TaxID=2709659 RepID=A0ABX0IAK5_9FLAO|nr:outer membrane beta-barrel protein [Flavobacterium difficile]NHM02712.1 PorT family protein [Flavobacterium difficile]
MKKSKNIERLFQEKFKDFEVAPPELVWENIQEKLNSKEQKRRILPFWFKTAGIAASFVAIGSLLFFNSNNNFKNTSTENNTVVTSEENQIHKNLNRNNIDSKTAKSNENKLNSSITNEAINHPKSNAVVTNTSTNSDSNINLEPAKKSNLNYNKVSNPKLTNNKSNTGFASNTVSKNKFEKKKTLISSSSEIVANNTTSNQYEKNYFKTVVPLSDIQIKNQSSNSGVTDFNVNKNLNISQQKNSGKTESNKFSFSDLPFNTIVSKPTDAVNNLEKTINTNSSAVVAIDPIKTDTTKLAIATIEENPMEKLLREKETKQVVAEKEKWSKWAVNSFVSPIFFNSFANGSPISDEFSSNEKSFNNSTSYGIGVSYAINKRLAIKTGVSNLNLDYDTENIAFYSSFEDQSKIANTNIERNSNSKYLVLKSENNLSKNTSEIQNIQSNQNLGNLNQRAQYIEVPLEMSYALLNKKVGVSLRGGMSTLFLTANEVSIKATDGTMQIGKASNLNTVHFSSNVGLGFSYNFMKSFQLNLEPTLRYQINTFNKNAENFSPYVIGVNTGISYKF